MSTLEERSVNTHETICRVEAKVDVLADRLDDLSDKFWGLKIKVALLAAGASGGVVGLVKLLNLGN